MELVDMRDLGSRAFSVWVRVPSGAPRRSKLPIACSDFFKKSERTHFAASPSQIEPAPLGFDLVGRDRRAVHLFRQHSANQYNPNQIFFIGDGFGLFVFFEKFEGHAFQKRRGKASRIQTQRAKKTKDIAVYLYAVPAQAASLLVPFRFEAGQGFSVLSL